MEVESLASTAVTTPDHDEREEPWGQAVVRLQSLEGRRRISLAPWFH